MKIKYYFVNTKLILISYFFLNLLNVKNNNENENLIKKKQFLILLENYLNINVRGFLNIIAICEGTVFKNFDNFNAFYDRIKKENGLYLPGINEYKVQFGYKKKINNFEDHPNDVSCINNLCSSAAGRYQILKKTFDSFLKKFEQIDLLFKDKEVKKIIRHIFYRQNSFYFNYHGYKHLSDFHKFKFGPFIQDLCAINLIIENNAIDLVKNKKYEEAIHKLSKIWASFPLQNTNKSFYNGQKARDINFIKLISEKIKNDLENIFEKTLEKIDETKKSIKNILSKINFTKNKNLNGKINEKIIKKESK